MTFPVLDQRPIVVATAGPNGAGKTTFYHAHLAPAGLRLVNADVLALELGLGAAEAMATANALRRALVALDTSFDPGPGPSGSLFGHVYAIALQGDGRVVIGDFTQVGGVTRNHLARISTDGTLDAGFNRKSSPWPV